MVLETTGDVLSTSGTITLTSGGRLDMTEEEFLGMKAFSYVRPEFSARVAAGMNIVVGGAGFGCGSSREDNTHRLIEFGEGLQQQLIHANLVLLIAVLYETIAKQEFLIAFGTIIIEYFCTTYNRRSGDKANTSG
jgi:hypothetical protein